MRRPASDGRSVLRMLAPMLGANRRAIRAGILLAMAAQAAQATIPLIQRVLIDETILSHHRSLAVWIEILILAGVLSFVGNYLRRSVGGKAAARSQRDLQLSVHHHMQYLDASGRDQFRTGDIMSRATSDLTLIQTYLQQLSIAYGNLTLLIVAMLFLSPLLALVMAVAVPVFFVVASRFRTRSFPATVELPLNLNWSQPGREFRLSDRGDRARVYELVLCEGGDADVLRYIDGALLVDLWEELVLPRAVRAGRSQGHRSVRSCSPSVAAAPGFCPPRNGPRPGRSRSRRPQAPGGSVWWRRKAAAKAKGEL
ncbi:MAG: ATP-binding cassette, subfamily bacterial [Mycobacterium sp.]|nr:ATP-binding cassette, subfamily bacterial [Mycobacterium sp.]